MQNRSFHFIPADKEELYARVEELSADHVIFDLEDGVSEADKMSARILLQNYLENNSRDRIWVRINSDNNLPEDMEVVGRFPEVGVVIPKYKEKGQLDILHHKQRALVLIEDFLSCQRLLEIADDKRIVAVGLGFEDMLSTIPIANARLTEFMKHIRMQASMKAKALGKISVDGISMIFHDLLSLKEECEVARDAAIDGKLTIHPKQIAVVNQVFGIEQELYNHAKRIQELSGLESNFGYQMIDGELITPPKVEKAKKIIECIEDKNGKI